MKSSLYEKIVNSYLQDSLKHIDNNNKHLKPLNESDSKDYLAQYLYRVLEQGLAQVKANKGTCTKIEKQIAICNEIVSVLDNNGIDTNGYAISLTAQRLMAIMDDAVNNNYSRPDTPLALGAILTGTRQDPNLVSQLKKEMVACDTIDILCSFIKWSGVNILLSALNEFTSVRGGKLRIITTSYMGATDSKAIDFLHKLPNTEIKVSYDTRRTRLHAKAYLFERNTGFSSAYVGSSNISNAALTDGLEWNIKVSQYEQPYQWEKIKATFDTYWNDKEFELYKDGDYEKLTRALSNEKSSFSTNDFVMPNFDINPYPFQAEILDNIEAERKLQNKNKHLVVAATGTGKTMIASFDFKHFRNEFKKNNLREPRLMFVAHREEILKQSLYTFRAVLRDQNFGDVMVGGHIPQQMEHVFVSIQTYNSKELYNNYGSDFYDYVVVDEFHHAAAKSYRVLLEHIKPKSLLGLTATPERADGLDIKHYFDHHITAEIRLPDAIDRKLLCPFQYFGVTDTVDYSHLKWQRGGYLASELTNIYTANDIRTKMIFEKTCNTVLDIRRIKGLGFCVSKQHAEYMCRKFNKYGVPSEFLTSDSDKDMRNTVQKHLVDGDINFIFVVDLYNEGVDIPEIDTVLFLRPTESLTIFLQQLGRGLRLVEGKDCLTVLDFVGQSNKNYRFDLKYKALIESTGHDLEKEISEGFPHLPAGCNIELERKSRDYILQNIKQTLNIRKSTIINQIEHFVTDTGKELSFENYLDYYNLSTFDFYRRTSWSRAMAEASLIPDINEPDEDTITKGLLAIQHIDDMEYIRIVLNCLTKYNVDSSNLNEVQKRYLTMFLLTIFKRKFKFIDIEEGFIKLLDNPIMYEEIIMLLRYKQDNIKIISPTIKLPFTSSLNLHCQYTQTELLTALGYHTLEKNHTVQAGVLEIKHIKTDIFFITLNKNEKDYSPTTMYKDYAINKNLFHWQSQSNTTIMSNKGQRYINHKKIGQTILLFVRENSKINNETSPYYYLGPVDYVSHEGEKPINFVWRLRCPMPAHLVRQTKRLGVG